METTLYLVTLLSVAIAATATAVAVRTMREERRRSAARIAALEAELSRPDEPSGTPNGLALFAPAAGAPAVPQTRPARPGPAPEAELAPAPTVRPVAPAPDAWQEPSAVREHSGPPVEIFAAPEGTGRAPRLGFVFMAVAAIGLGAALFVMGGAGGAAQAPSGPDAGDPGLELVSLRHERSGSTWTITGLVRNPLSAPAADHLNAVAFLFDDSGAFVASGRSPVEFEKLGPGDESPFVIRVEAPGRVARYRVSFRASDGGMVKHVDRRNDPQGPPRS